MREVHTVKLKVQFPSWLFFFKCLYATLLVSSAVFCPRRSVLEPLAQWDSPMQVKLSCWKSGLNTLLVELLPWALLANHSQWDLWLFEGETIVLQIPAGKVIVPPNLKVGLAKSTNLLRHCNFLSVKNYLSNL